MTPLEIVNSAMTKMGAQLLLSLTADTKEAKRAKARIQPVTDIVLRAHPWTCATKRAILQATTDVVPFDYTYSLTLPTDFIRLVAIDLDDYRLESNRIICNDARAEIRYVARQTDISDPLCAETIAWYLAWDLSYTITQSGEHQGSMWKGYLNSLKQARFVNALENPQIFVDADDLLEEHHG